MRRLVTAIFCAFALCCANSIQAAPGKRDVDIADLVEVKTPSNVTISPDGAKVAYILTTPSLAANSLTVDLYLVSANGREIPRKLASLGTTDSALASAFEQALTWSPDSRSLVLLHRQDEASEIRAVEIGTGRTIVLVSQDMLPAGYEIQSSRGATFRFSPDGRKLAFVARRTATAPLLNAPLMRAIDAGEEWQPIGKHLHVSLMSPTTLFTLDLENRTVTRLTGDDYGVASFNWSPDGNRLALSLYTDLTRRSSYYTSDIFVLEVMSRQLRPLVQQEGRDDDPLWSPDGREIAFSSQGGQENGRNSKTLALVAADGASLPRYIGRYQLDHWVDANTPVRWSSDRNYIDLLVAYDMARQLLRVRVKDGAVTRLTPRADRHYFGQQSEGISYSADKRQTAFVIQGVGVPPEVAVADADFRAVRQLTDLNPALSQVNVPVVDRVRWRSSDGKWELNGLLLKSSNYMEGRRYPLLTVLLGGPAMVSQTFNPSFNYPLLALAKRGYVIFIPNTRGRPGYGMNFAHAIRDEKSYVLNPLSDALSGIDLLIERGVADPDRLGVMGFSYGGTLTANIITHTDRFKAAIYGEGSPDIVGNGLRVTREFRTLYRDMRGLGIIFEPSVFRKAFEESAMFRLDRVTTPVMVESGEESVVEIDRPFFRGLQHFGVPSIWRIYPRSGHGWDEPALVKDAYEHHIAWFDYWLLDKPYPDARRQVDFDTWKRKQVN